jgi:uncharacterized protein YbcV (DUF1398 family)
MNPTANAATLNTDAIRECMAASFNDMPFPEVVRRLAAAGVERYRADLILRRKTYYGAGDLSLAEPLQPFSAEVADAFCEGDVKRAIAAIQQKQIGYREFLTRIMTAGVAASTSSFAAAKPFPSARTATSISSRFRGAHNPLRTNLKHNSPRGGGVRHRPFSPHLRLKSNLL